MNLKHLLKPAFILSLMFLTNSQAQIISGEKNMPNQSEKIKQVENGLRPKYFVKGDKLKSINEVMKEMNIPGISVAIINNFEVVWSKGYGVADTETQQPVDENTIFQAASISKPVTAMAVMKMVQDGKLDLDRNINTYLKSWQLEENELTAKKAVTLKNLLSHNAGVTVHGFPGYKPDAPFPTLVQVLNGETPANTGKIFVDMEPETQWRYSGGGTTIVQQAMIDQENKSFQELMQEKILNPIGMSNSFYSNSILNEKQLKNATAGHYNDGTLVVGKRHIYPEMAAAGLWTTAQDLAKFAVEIQKSLKGESNKVLNKQFTETMTTPVLKGELNIGLFNQKIGEEQFLSHAGGNEGFSCDLLFHKTKGYGIVLMTNSRNCNGLMMPLFRSAASVYGWSDVLPPDFEEVVLTNEEKVHFYGSYQLDFDKMARLYFVNNNKLVFKISCDPEKQVTPISKLSLITADRVDKISISADFDKFFLNDKELKRNFNDDEMLAADYIEAGYILDAVDCYQKLLEKDAEAIKWLENYLNNAGYYFISQNNFKIATGFLKTNSILFPQSGNVWDSLGEAYFFDKKYELTIETMKKALKINPNNQNAISKIKEAEELLQK